MVCRRSVWQVFVAAARIVLAFADASSELGFDWALGQAQRRSSLVSQAQRSATALAFASGQGSPHRNVAARIALAFADVFCELGVLGTQGRRSVCHDWYCRRSVWQVVALEALVLLNAGIFQRLSVVFSTTGHFRSCLQAFISYCSCCGQGRTCNGCVCFSRSDGNRRESLLCNIMKQAVFGSRQS